VKSNKTKVSTLRDKEIFKQTELLKEQEKKIKNAVSVNYNVNTMQDSHLFNANIDSGYIQTKLLNQSLTFDSKRNFGKSFSNVKPNIERRMSVDISNNQKIEGRPSVIERRSSVKDSEYVLDNECVERIDMNSPTKFPL